MFGSPLRYPGGKGDLTPYFKELLSANGLENGTYVEPFAGGAGIAINLLISGSVNRIALNDADSAVYSFWKSIIDDNEEFVELVKTIPLNIEEWSRQKEISLHPRNHLEQGFSTFYLNRTNRSGILRAGPIGGHGQSGKYRLDARFNREDLSSRIKAIGERADDIDVTCTDANHFLDNMGELYDIDDTLIYIDPPYFEKGSLLYLNAYDEDDHVELSETIRKSEFKWVLSYDNNARIREIYSWTRPFEFQMYYSAYSKKLGHEVFFSSDKIELPIETCPVKSTSQLDMDHCGPVCYREGRQTPEYKETRIEYAGDPTELAALDEFVKRKIGSTCYISSMPENHDDPIGIGIYGELLAKDSETGTTSPRFVKHDDVFDAYFETSGDSEWLAIPYEGEIRRRIIQRLQSSEENTGGHRGGMPLRIS